MSPLIPQQPLVRIPAAQPTPFAPPVTMSVNTTAAGPLAQFINGNANWAANITASDPEFLPKLALAQAPPLLWVGCADSRVPESVIMDQLPGQVFTHVRRVQSVVPGSRLTRSATLPTRCTSTTQTRTPSSSTVSST